jgi:hypothetical protein
VQDSGNYVQDSGINFFLGLTILIDYFFLPKGGGNQMKKWL